MSYLKALFFNFLFGKTEKRRRRRRRWRWRWRSTLHWHSLPWVQWLLSNNNNLSSFVFLNLKLMSIQPQWIIYQKWKKNRTKHYEFFIDNDILLKRRMEPTNKQTIKDADNTEKCIVKSDRYSLILEKEIPKFKWETRNNASNNNDSNNDQAVFVYPCRSV